jgi:hypothetical protein
MVGRKPNRAAALHTDLGQIGAGCGTAVFASLIPVIALARGVLDVKNNDFVGGFVGRVIDQISIFPGHDSAYAGCMLPPARRRKKK